MKSEEVLDDAVSEEVSDSFLCCICLDLLYKPVVLCCGHVSCFWCVHKSMNQVRESNCPICRSPYKHFPSICEMMHFLLSKMYPLAYKRRELQILEFERKEDYFSPQLDYNAFQGCASKGEHCGSMEQRQPVLRQNPDKNCGVNVNVEGENFSQLESKENSAGITTSDAQCLACKQLLFQPVVLNCGHVYCKTCIVCPGDSPLKCQVCQSLHPGDFPKVCLELDRFLEEKFFNDYTTRRDSVRLPQFQNENTNTGSTEASKMSSSSTENSSPRSSDPQLSVHAGVGCDSCGVYPIVGDRYRCKDCFEKIGFDLCGDCYNTPSKVAGRFNQKHTQEHKYELVKLNTGHHSMSRRGNLRVEYAPTLIALPQDISRSSFTSTEDVDNQSRVENVSSPIDHFGHFAGYIPTRYFLYTDDSSLSGFTIASPIEDLDDENEVESIP